MHLKRKAKNRQRNENSYGFNRSREPYPKNTENKSMPPKLSYTAETKELFKPKEKASKEQVIQEFMDGIEKLREW